VVVAGAGNNGGDGWVAARRLHERGQQVIVLAAKEVGDDATPASQAAREAVAAGVESRVPDWPAMAMIEFADCAVIVDALLGTGSRGEPREPLATLIQAIDDADAVVVSADLPSGVDSDTGAAPGAAVAADVTVTFSAMKVGCLLQPGASLCGEIVVADIGVPEDALVPEDSLEVWDDDEYAELLPPLAIGASKHTRGHVVVIGGAPGLTGAACLAATGALRSGAGYVTVAVPAPSLAVVEMKLTAPVKRALPADVSGALTAAALEAALGVCEAADAVVIGPGLGRAGATLAVVRQLIRRIAVPLVIDADALFALGHDLTILAERTAPTVLTPHTGEAARLLDFGADVVDADRPAAVRALAQRGCTAVLKGPATLIAEGGRLVVNTTGGPGLATLGTGDVLSGVVATFLAQGLAPLDAAALGVHIHGAAGDAASEDLTPVCCTSEDVVAYLPEAFAALLMTRCAPTKNEEGIIDGGSHRTGHHDRRPDHRRA
jgi:NAD(P)H-hydrate epimerase